MGGLLKGVVSGVLSDERFPKGQEERSLHVLVEITARRGMFTLPISDVKLLFGAVQSGCGKSAGRCARLHVDPLLIESCQI